MAFAQLTHRESLRDIEIGLRAHGSKLYPMGIAATRRATRLPKPNNQLDWRIYAIFAQELIRITLHADDDVGLELDITVFVLDASTIDPCLSVFPVGAVPLNEVGRQAPRPSARQHPHVRPCSMATSRPDHGWNS